MRTTRCAAGCGRPVPVLDLKQPTPAIRCSRCIRLAVTKEAS